ncbi:glycoside hydrolase family 57 protein [Acidiferrobacter sp.]|uniref:glycoside hydrolase family 57 protein n=1 Tax=Acidiferrobacter sp. TaxID=1872107 RepID=UPI00262EA685|nr:glycoside hydrolase family 57 protein [Acidiferrobacter sp.]
MQDENHLDLVLCWHMHQPQYRRLSDGQYQQPWVYLHAIKDYVDMAAHIESVPGARAVVNFSPVLLDQIADYGEQVQAYLRDGTPLRDPLLAALAGHWPPPGAQRAALIEACLKANKTRVIDRFPEFKRLVALAAPVVADPGLSGYLDHRYLRDLVIWYHLGWFGETVRRTDARIARLLQKCQEFDEGSVTTVLTVVAEILTDIVPRYRRLAESGQVELSFTPYTHPIVPLLLDFTAAREAQPDVQLPAATHYPGGEARSRWQIRAGQEAFARHFGFWPAGCWPAEGGLSAQMLALLDDAGVKWTASGERVLRHSLQASGKDCSHGRCHAVYGERGRTVRCVFRDDGLSDLIGFSYADWHADDAVGNLISHLETMARAAKPGDAPLVTIIMDGENAWEYYPENGYYFLRALYERLTSHPLIRLTTFSRYLDEGHVPAELPPLVAGSWVNGTFATWVGSADKNRAWDILVQAKTDYDRVMAQGRLLPEDAERAAEALAVCEGSDWCWWFGDYNPRDTVQEFERQYRQHITDLYHILGEPLPPLMGEGFTQHGADRSERGGAMRSSGAI